MSPDNASAHDVLSDNNESSTHRTTPLVVDTQSSQVTVADHEQMLAPAERLPPEILTMIFGFCPDHHARIHITHTCHAWRTAALHCQSLWQDIDFAHGYRWAAEILQNRAPSVPVTLRSEGWRTSSERLALVSQHLGRTRVLHLAGGETMGRWARDGGLSPPAPLLETFAFYSLSNLKYRLPGSLFSGYAPRLRAAAIRIATPPPLLPLSPSVFAGLVTFSVTITNSDSSDPPIKLDGLLDTLAGMHALKKLDLGYYLPDATGRESRAAVDMPCLSTLKLRGEISSCTLLLSHLRIDSQAHLELHPKCTEDNRDIAPFFSALGSHLRPDHTGFQGLHLTPTEAAFSMNRRFYDTLALHAWREETSHPDLAISFQWPQYPHTLSRDVIHKYCNMLPARCNALRTVTVRSEVGWGVTVDEWQDLLEHAPLVQLVKAYEHSSLSFCQLLYRDATSSDDPSHRPRCAPALKFLKLYMPETATAWRLLIDCLAARGKCRAPVEELSLEVNEMDAVVENKLRELVARVVVQRV
ncbi:hypothetical protein FA95DRAFT_1609085 [Auriscalpium vulgare]|uniref:Uncharacterized protein n=1 Tax=Auriscalpium vulgare TaxID=40419 RepID=A0ACB8RJU7_9AGAM|nr:hypothetical protein FA95DRAFT_1609085 [Auriscalpium vulgare]